VDRLVKLLGHRLELRSESGKGSVFALEVPVAANPINSPVAIAAQTAQDQDAAQEADKSPLSGKRLLVVDDDAMALSGTSNLLISWGCKVSTAASLAEVWQLLQNGMEWDFIISDYQLGNNANGIDVIDAVRQHQNKPTPCVLISGDTSQAVLKLASANGHHLLHKPVKPAKLKSLTIHLLKG
jgi:CheY-like chemotaxis protein